MKRLLRFVKTTMLLVVIYHQVWADEPWPGLNIVVYSNGSVRKVVME